MSGAVVAKERIYKRTKTGKKLLVSELLDFMAEHPDRYSDEDIEKARHSQDKFEGVNFSLYVGSTSAIVFFIGVEEKKRKFCGIPIEKTSLFLGHCFARWALADRRPTVEELKDFLKTLRGKSLGGCVQVNRGRSFFGHIRNGQKISLNFEGADTAAIFSDYVNALSVDEARAVFDAEAAVQRRSEAQKPPVFCTNLKSGNRYTFRVTNIASVQARHLRIRTTDTFSRSLLATMLCFSPSVSFDFARELFGDKCAQLHQFLTKVSDANKKNLFLFDVVACGLLWGRRYLHDYADNDDAFALYCEQLEAALNYVDSLDDTQASHIKSKSQVLSFVAGLPERGRTPEPLAYQFEKKLACDVAQMASIRNRAADRLKEHLAKTGTSMVEEALVAKSASELIRVHLPEKVAKKRALPDSADLAEMPAKKSIAGLKKTLDQGVVCELVSRCLPKAVQNAFLILRCRVEGVYKRVKFSVPNTKLDSSTEAERAERIARWEGIVKAGIQKKRTLGELRLFASQEQKGVKGAWVILHQNRGSKGISLIVCASRMTVFENNLTTILVSESEKEEMKKKAEALIAKFYSEGVFPTEIPRKVIQKLRAFRDKKNKKKKQASEKGIWRCKLKYVENGQNLSREVTFSTEEQVERYKKEMSKVRPEDRLAAIEQACLLKKEAQLPMAFKFFSVPKSRYKLLMNEAQAFTFLGDPGLRYIGQYPVDPKQDDMPKLKLLCAALAIAVGGNENIELSKQLFYSIKAMQLKLREKGGAARHGLLQFILAAVKNCYDLDSSGRLLDNSWIYYLLSDKAPELFLAFLEQTLQWLNDEAQTIATSTEAQTAFSSAFMEAQRAIYQRISLIKLPAGICLKKDARDRFRVLQTRAQSDQKKWDKRFKKRVVIALDAKAEDLMGDERELRQALEARLKALLAAAREKHPSAQIVFSTAEDCLHRPILNPDKFQRMLRRVVSSDRNCVCQFNVSVAEVVSGADSKAVRLSAIQAQYECVEALNVGNGAAVAHYLSEVNEALGDKTDEPVYVVSHRTFSAAKLLGQKVKQWVSSKKTPFAAPSLLREGKLDSNETMHLPLPLAYPRVYEPLPDGCVAVASEALGREFLVSETCLEHKLNVRSQASGQVNPLRAIYLTASNGIDPGEIDNPIGDATGVKPYGLSVSNDRAAGAHVYGGCAKSRFETSAYVASLGDSSVMKPLPIQKGGDRKPMDEPPLPVASLVALESILGEVKAPLIYQVVRQTIKKPVLAPRGQKRTEAAKSSEVSAEPTQAPRVKKIRCTPPAEEIANLSEQVVTPAAGAGIAPSPAFRHLDDFDGRGAGAGHVSDSDDEGSISSSWFDSGDEPEVYPAPVAAVEVSTPFRRFSDRKASAVAMQKMRKCYVQDSDEQLSGADSDDSGYASW